MTLGEFINAMQVGWNEVPKNTVGLSYIGHPNLPNACCPMVHAFYGVVGRATYVMSPRLRQVLPFAFSQNVVRDDEEINLASAIIILADMYHWTTPRIIAWLKTHL